MRHRMGQAEKSSWGFWDYVPIALGGGLAAYGIYLYVREKFWPSGSTVAAEVAPKQAPSKFATFADVSKRFVEVKELWRMGYIEPPQVISELRVLQDEALAKAASNQATRVEADNLIAQMQAFSNDVGYDLLAKRLTGNTYRVTNRLR